MELLNKCRLVSITLFVVTLLLFFLVPSNYFVINWFIWIVSAVAIQHYLVSLCTDEYLTQLSGKDSYLIHISLLEIRKSLYDNVFKGIVFSKLSSGLYGYAYIIDCRSKDRLVNIDMVISKMKAKKDYLRPMSLYQSGMYLSYNLVLILLYFIALLFLGFSLFNVINITCLFMPIGVAMRFGTLHCSIISSVYKSYNFIMTTKGGVKIR